MQDFVCFQVSSWIETTDSMSTIALLMISLDCLVTMATVNETKLKYSLLQIQLVQNVLKKQVIIY